MYHIRKTKTASGAVAIQVVHYADRVLIVDAHVGSAHTDEGVKTLKTIAAAWIEKAAKQSSIFPASTDRRGLALVSQCAYLGIRYAFLYEILHKLVARFGFSAYCSTLLQDLVIMRMVEPTSKRRSFELLEEYFGIHHRRQAFYESVPWWIALKDRAERSALAVAAAEFKFDFSLVFYDVTTLYFESFEPDDLRKPGFSKDNKFNQPQIVIGLVVSNEGFPVAYEIFPGNKFEGHTLIPVIESFKRQHAITTLTVVADAAMISLDNIEALKQHGLHYIVGARMGNLPQKLMHEIADGLQQRDGATLRVGTAHGMLVCDFSLHRYRKDKRDMDKQIKKAEGFIRDPAALKRTKFLKLGGNAAYQLNTELIEKHTRLLGIKGYYTNLGSDVSDRVIINQYHNLWRVEQAFRVAKNDLQMRPIFHFKQETIKVHVLICFMALAVSKYLEIKTATSLQQIIASFKRVTDARLLNTLTKEEIVMRTKIPERVRTILKKLELPY